MLVTRAQSSIKTCLSVRRQYDAFEIIRPFFLFFRFQSLLLLFCFLNPRKSRFLGEFVRRQRLLASTLLQLSLLQRRRDFARYRNEIARDYGDGAFACPYARSRGSFHRPRITTKEIIKQRSQKPFAQAVKKEKKKREDTKFESLFEERAQALNTTRHSELSRM